MTPGSYEELVAASIVPVGAVTVGYSVLSWFGWNSAGLILQLERTAATPE